MNRFYFCSDIKGLYNSSFSRKKFEIIKMILLCRLYSIYRIIVGILILFFPWRF